MLRASACFAIFALAKVGVAQDVISARAGLIYFVEGRVSVDGNRLKTGGKLHQLAPGDDLTTDHGRAEVLLNPGTVLRLGELTRIRMDSVDLVDTRVSIEAGSAVITVGQTPKFDRVEIDIGGAEVVLKGEGVYRFDGGGEPRMRVYAGEAEIAGGDGLSTTVAKRGQAVCLQDLKVAKFDTGDADALQLWATSRGGAPAIRAGQPRMPVLLHALFGGRPRTPVDLVRYVNAHVPFEWRAMGEITGSAGYVIQDCAEYKPDCSAALLEVPDLPVEIVVLRKDAAPPAFLLYRKNAAAWEFSGAYGVGSELEPDYRVIQRGSKTYLEVTRGGLSRGGIDVEIEDWIDLSGPEFTPAFSLFTKIKRSEDREYETTASIVSWDTGPVETIRVEYRASDEQDQRPAGTRTASATFLRHGDRFVFDPLASDVPERARWGEYNVDGVRLLSH